MGDVRNAVLEMWFIKNLYFLSGSWHPNGFLWDFGLLSKLILLPLFFDQVIEKKSLTISNLWQILLYKTEKLVLLTKLIFEHPLDSLHVSWKWSKESQLNLIDFYHEQILWSIVSSVLFWHYTGTDGCKFVYNVISYGIPANTVWQSLHTLTLYIYKHVTNFIKGW